MWFVCEYENVELTGWQTVAISLGGGVGGGAVTAMAVVLSSLFRGRQESARLERRLEHERDHQARELEAARGEHWRDRLVRAADDFSTATHKALFGLRDATRLIMDAEIQQSIDEEDGRERQDVADYPPLVEKAAELKRLVDDTHERFGRVQLLFGEKSDAGVAALNVLRALRTGLKVVAGYRPDAYSGDLALDEASKANSLFGQSALAEIRDPKRLTPAE